MDRNQEGYESVETDSELVEARDLNADEGAEDELSETAVEAEDQGEVDVGEADDVFAEVIPEPDPEPQCTKSRDVRRALEDRLEARALKDDLDYLDCEM